MRPPRSFPFPCSVTLPSSETKSSKGLVSTMAGLASNYFGHRTRARVPESPANASGVPPPVHTSALAAKEVR